MLRKRLFDDLLSNLLNRSSLSPEIEYFPMPFGRK